jgi:hypothetical protein
VTAGFVPLPAPLHVALLLQKDAAVALTHQTHLQENLQLSVHDYIQIRCNKGTDRKITETTQYSASG